MSLRSVFVVDRVVFNSKFILNMYRLRNKALVITIKETILFFSHAISFSNDGFLPRGIEPAFGVVVAPCILRRVYFDLVVL